MPKVTTARASETPAVQRTQIVPNIPTETGKLRTVAMWGPFSTEAVLAQLYPADVSLFLKNMDVKKAREEIRQFQGLLRERGVNVVEVKAELAKIIEPQDLSKDEILAKLYEKAKSIKVTYGTNGLNGDSLSAIQADLNFALQTDINEYGEAPALAMTKMLCLDHQFPLGNIIYARDQSNVVFGHRIVSNMAKSIREPEVQLYEKVYSQILSPEKIIEIPKGENFEGGDLIVHRGTVYVGVGPRTSLGAAIHIFKSLKASHPDIKFAIVKKEGSDQSSFQEQQETMHLDTYAMPAGEHAFAVCDDEGNKRRVSLIEISENGEIIVKPTGKSLIEYLKAESYNILSVPKAEQKTFGCNFVLLDSDTILVPGDYNRNIIDQLQASGKLIVNANLRELGKASGNAHCALMPIQRD